MLEYTFPSSSFLSLLACHHGKLRSLNLKCTDSGLTLYEWLTDYWVIMTTTTWTSSKKKMSTNQFWFSLWYEKKTSSTKHNILIIVSHGDDDGWIEFQQQQQQKHHSMNTETLLMIRILKKIIDRTINDDENAWCRQHTTTSCRHTRCFIVN